MKPSVGKCARLAAAAVMTLAVSADLGRAAEVPDFRADIEPLLTEYCYECHGFGSKEGQVAFDELKTDEDLLRHPELWQKALQNLRAGIMPPADKPRPNDEEREMLARWVKFKAFGIDPQNVDPGQVTLRRLNRAEYRNTVRELMGVEFNTTEEFPADDTGYGFDNIGDVLSVSPLLLEKLLQAADSIVASTVPKVPKAVREERIPGDEFRGGDDAKVRGTKLTFYAPAKVASTFIAEHSGTYTVSVEITVDGHYEFDPGRCRFLFSADGEEKVRQEYGWRDGDKFTHRFDVKWEAGRHNMTVEVEPLVEIQQKKFEMDVIVNAVTVQGPQEEEFWQPSKNYNRFFTRPQPPETDYARRQYANELIYDFARRAFRRPPQKAVVERLVTLAESVYQEEGRRFEEGISRAMVAMLASPRFLFRFEQVEPGHEDDKFAPVDEFSLASRLSYFLWSSMPDDELLDLAEAGKLRENLNGQVTRMLKDRRASALFENFVGQWLQTRDVDGIPINEQAVLMQEDEEIRKLFELLRLAETDEERRTVFRRIRARPRVELNTELRKAIRRETEMCFEYVVREDRSILELLDSDYTFVNERLAKHYGMPDMNGAEMRKVVLPPDSPRGGVLTQAAVLIVTSNPSRTSPVKRGLFVLDNILGTPTPPPIPNVPALEESEKAFAGRQPTGRELLEVHRENALCSSCHARLDPLGFGFENFNAMGMWRDRERGQQVDSAGQLVTGESFKNVRELKRILVEKYRPVFYRCLAEKLLTYALGRGLSYHDTQTVDIIVDRLEQGDGKFSALLMGIVDSAPFQQRRNVAADETPQAPEANENASN